jgi:hypothetical protein
LLPVSAFAVEVPGRKKEGTKKRNREQSRRALSFLEKQWPLLEYQRHFLKKKYITKSL